MLEKGRGFGSSPKLEFLSLLIMPDGSIRCDPQNTDRHDALIDHYGLPDSSQFLRSFVKARFTVDDIDDLPDVSKYKLILCEEYEPIWLTEYVVTIALKRCRSIINRMIISDKRFMLLGGCWIIVKGARVSNVLNGRIIYMADGLIKYFRGGSLENYKSGLIKHRKLNG